MLTHYPIALLVLGVICRQVYKLARGVYNEPN